MKLYDIIVAIIISYVYTVSCNNYNENDAESNNIARPDELNDKDFSDLIFSFTKKPSSFPTTNPKPDEFSFTYEPTSILKPDVEFSYTYEPTIFPTNPKPKPEIEYSYTYLPTSIPTTITNPEVGYSYTYLPSSLPTNKPKPKPDVEYSYTYEPSLAQTLPPIFLGTLEPTLSPSAKPKVKPLPLHLREDRSSVNSLKNDKFIKLFEDELDFKNEDTFEANLFENYINKVYKKEDSLDKEDSKAQSKDYYKNTDKVLKAKDVIKSNNISTNYFKSIYDYILSQIAAMIY